MKRLVPVILILLLGFALRLYRLDAVPFRGDEAFSVQRWTDEPLSISLTQIAALEPHPPLTYILFRAWGLVFGTKSEFLLRMLPLLCNILGIPALYAIAKRLSGQQAVAYVAAFFWAIHPFQIWHAQDFRNYGIWAGLSALVLYFALRLISGKREKWDWGLYTSIALISSLIFYNELITIGVLGLLVLLLCYREWRFVLQWGFLNIGIIAVTIAAFIYFQGNLLTGGGYGGTTGGFEAWQWWQRFLPELSFGETLSLSLQQQFGPYSNWWPLVLISLALSYLFVLLKNRQAGLFLLFVGIVPLLMLGLISTRLHIFRPRYVLMAAPAYTLIVSYAIWLLWNYRFGRILALLLFSIWLSLSTYSLNNYYHDPAFAKAPDWPALVAYLQENTQLGEVIIQTGVDPAFGLYYDLADIAAGEFALPADVTQPIPKVIEAMENTATDYHSIWIVGQTFPDWPNAGVVENWASERLQLVRETSIAGLPVRQFMDWDVLPTEIEETPVAVFGEIVQLRGTRVFVPEPSGELTIWLYWQPQIQAEASLKIFVHLVGAINPATGSPLWSQDDQFPQDRRVDSLSWEIGTTFRDVYVLPLEGVSAGNYSVLVGFYNPETNERLLLDDETDAFSIATVEIK